MAKKTIVEKEINMPTSARSAAYEQAKAFDGSQSVLKTIAAYVKSVDKDFGQPKYKNEELEAELDEGYNLRFAEMQPSVPYIITGQGDFVNLSDKTELPKGHSVLTYSYVIGLTTVQFGKIENKGLKTQIGMMRDLASTYRSNRKSDLKKAILGVVRKPRAANKTLMESWQEFFKAQEKKVTHGKQTGDPHADMVTFKLARDAFFEVIKSRIQ